ncbi:YggT family protein [Sphingomonas sp. 1P06PA]|uniref:YggT family protein n=1 Tax=Sphingomonas sp. 1P06PA TaxID=554121 RepID=UPI0039A52D1E
MQVLLEVLLVLLNVAWWIIVIQAILSWLIVFNVINMSSPVVRQVVELLDRMTQPLYRPIRRIMPDFGGLDFSPLVVLLLIFALQRVIQVYMLPAVAGY